MFLRYVHSFRAVAIVVIVAGHAVFVLAWPEPSRTRDLLLDLLDSGTVLFVFVAGFLFHHLAGRFDHRDYLTKKLTNVLVPYLVVSVPAVVYTVLFTELAADRPVLAGTSVVYQAFWLLFKGGATFLFSLWFIPMITLFYLAAPLFMLMRRHPRLYLVLLVLVPYSLLAHRTDELDTVGIALYFLSSYVLGMWASHYRTRMEDLLDRYWAVLAGAFLAAVLVMFLVLDHHGNYYGAAPFSQEHGLIDWMYLQKLLACFALLGVLRRFDGVLGERLRYLGDISFTVFFVHGYLLMAVLVVSGRLVGGPPPGNVATFLLLTTGVVLATMGGTALVRRVFGRRSRYLIGS